MEYMDGGTLAERVGAMALPQALWTVIAVTKDVRHVHCPRRCLSQPEA